MKNLLILGCSRSGKSTFARMVAEKYGHSIVSMDDLMFAFAEVFPKLGIRIEDPGNTEKGYYAMTNFLVSLIWHLCHYRSDAKFVIEGGGVDIGHISKAVDRRTCEVIIFGYPNTTPEAFIAEARGGGRPSARLCPRGGGGRRRLHSRIPRPPDRKLEDGPRLGAEPGPQVRRHVGGSRRGTFRPAP